MKGIPQLIGQSHDDAGTSTRTCRGASMACDYHALNLTTQTAVPNLTCDYHAVYHVLMNHQVGD